MRVRVRSVLLRYQNVLFGLIISVLLSGCVQPSLQAYCPHSLEITALSDGHDSQHYYFEAWPSSVCFTPVSVQRFQLVTDMWRYRERVVWQNEQSSSYLVRSKGGYDDETDY